MELIQQFEVSAKLFEIHICDFEEFRFAAKKAEKTILSLGHNSKNAKTQNSVEREDKIDGEFQFLRSASDAHRFHNPFETNLDEKFVSLFACEGDERQLVGFALIKLFSAEHLHSELQHFLFEKGNVKIAQHGSDCVTLISVRLNYQGIGLSSRLLEAVADTIVARHIARGGCGPALMKLSTLEERGRERLLRACHKIAAERDDIVIGFGYGDIENLGLYIDPNGWPEAPHKRP